MIGTFFLFAVVAVLMALAIVQTGLMIAKEFGSRNLLYLRRAALEHRGAAGGKALDAAVLEVEASLARLDRWQGCVANASVLTALFSKLPELLAALTA